MIAFDAISSVAAASATSLTFSHTCTGSDRILFVAGRDKVAAASVVTGITYAGVSMNKINGIQIPANRFMTLWYMIAPATGANNVVVTASESVSLRFYAVSYTGASQTGQPDNSDTSTTSSGTSISTDLITTADNSWMFMSMNDDTGGLTYTTSTGDTIRLNADAGGMVAMDTGGVITPPASNTMTLTNASAARNIGALAASFSPVGGAPPTSADGFPFF